MKTAILPDGTLRISADSRQALIAAIVFALLLIIADGSLLWLSLHHQYLYPPLDSMDGAIPLISNVFIAGFAVWAFFFIPIRREIVMSQQAVDITDRWVFKSRTTPYPMARVDHFGFALFEQYRSTRWGTLIAMHLDSGEEVRLFKLGSTDECEVAHAAMKSYFGSLGRKDLVYELPYSGASG